MTAQPPDQPGPEQRSVRRHRSSAVVVVFRADDVMRTGIEARLTDVAMKGVGFDIGEPLAVNEKVKLTLRNDIQRIETETRGTVRRVSPREDGSPGWHVGVELFNRLESRDISPLRSGIGDVDSDGPVWI